MEHDLRPASIRSMSHTSYEIWGSAGRPLPPDCGEILNVEVIDREARTVATVPKAGYLWPPKEPLSFSRSGRAIYFIFAEEPARPMVLNVFYCPS